MPSFDPTKCITFRKTREAWGGYSNMAAGFPLRLFDLEIATSESLYQACRFPDDPALQGVILAIRNPMHAKMATKPHRHLTRGDWEVGDARVKAMEWALRIKLMQHPVTFGDLLMLSGTLDIVEDSPKDRFWGAVRDYAGMLNGANMLGCLLMKLREEVRENGPIVRVAPPELPNFKIAGVIVPVLTI